MSSQAELEESELQLVQINQALKDSPDDSELLALKAELENLIQLTKDYLKQQASTASSSSSKHHDHHNKAGGSSSTSAASASTANFSTGASVLAKWHKDHKFYPGIIANVAGTTDDPVYTVIFDVDKSTEVLRKGDVKAMSESKKRAFQFSGGGGKDSDGAASDSAASGSGAPSKRAKQAAEKSEKKALKEEDRKTRVAEQNSRQSSWQSFAKKSTKKGVHIPGVKGESLFKTPDNPYGRVGVTGSGKGMTSYAAKQRVKFTGAEGSGEQQP
ncbi:hypothetical protein P389DRAFT_192507 [Cystobasidium minutum MCA 4210]|uniref:uncharacterized protein n=1 Tax=Cystobasidium minutum MCA 4210 TaxID=1397322 RepID=UPI0034CD51EA|eukprot:jgi/Rhomi1/192507/gm1.721_g